MKKAGVIILAAAMLICQTDLTVIAEEITEIEETDPVSSESNSEINSPEEQASEEASEIRKEEPKPSDNTDNQESDEERESDTDTVSSDNTNTEKESVSEDRAEKEAFAESRTINGVTISVEAEEGVFPEDAVLSIKKANYIKEKQAVTIHGKFLIDINDNS